MAQAGFLSTLVLAVCSCTAASSQSIEERGAEALAEGDYQTAVSLALPMAEAGDGEYQFAVGYFLLEWLLDAEPKTPPTHSYADALPWIYKAADQDIPQAASTIRSGYEWGRYSFPKDAELARCWSEVGELHDERGRSEARGRCYELESERGVGSAKLR